MDTATYLELQTIKERLSAMEEKVEYIATANMEKGIIPKPKEEKDEKG